MKSDSAGSEITPQEFRSLSYTSQLEQLRRADAFQKAMLLIEAENGEELMAGLPTQEVFLMVKELGADQVPELLALASSEQWMGFFDFECWRGDRIDPTRARFWLALLLDGDDDRIVATLQQMSFELLILMVKKEVLVLAGPETIEDNDVSAEGINRLGGYQLDYRDETGAKLYGALIDRLFNSAPEFCRYLLEAVRAETESLIEESVYQQRCGRMLDLGFPDAYEARGVYAWLDPETFEADARGKFTLGLAGQEPAPGFVMTMARPNGLLGEILESGLDDVTGWELACLINKVAMADRIDIGDIDQVQSVIRKTYGLLNLALEFMAGTELDTARHLLEDVYCERLFRLGFSLTLRLQRRARNLVGSTIGPYLDGPFRALLTPMLESCPRFYQGMEQEGREDVRLFASLHEVRICEEWLDLLEIQRRLFENHFDFVLLPPEAFDLEDCTLETAEFLTLSEIFLTALANRLLGRAFRPDPVAPAELAELHRMVCRDGTLMPELIEQTAEWLETLEENAGGFAEYCLEIWQEAFCEISAGDLDPRYVSGILVRKSDANSAGA